jgi:DNA-directed RNA polymerase subunit RPC12/RpoP
MGRKARHRAEEREEKRPHGLGPEDEKANAGGDRCPRCGSTRLVVMQRPVGVEPYAPAGDVVCLNCNWQGKMGPGY